MPRHGQLDTDGEPTAGRAGEPETSVFGELPAAEQTVLRCGTYVGDYQLLYPIADGGMGAVWCGRPRKRTATSPRSVVIKTILPHLAAEPRLQSLFLDELEVASRIHHENVVEIRKTGESAGILFAIMDDIDGGSLSAFQKWVVLNQRPARVPDILACDLIAQAARGLHEAHELRSEDGAFLGVVHRDTSPQNILVDSTGRALVIDFGLAKSSSRIAEPSRSTSMRGKLRYMAPEQAAGRPVDRRVDVWALGATLHHLVTGTTPYDGPSDMVVLHALVTGQALLPLPPYVRPEVAEVLRKCLAHDPEARFPSAAALADELDRVVSSSDSPRPTSQYADLIDGFVHSSRVRRNESFDRALQSLQHRETIPDLGETSSPSPVIGLDDVRASRLFHERRPTTEATPQAVPIGDPPAPSEGPSSKSATRQLPLARSSVDPLASLESAPPLTGASSRRARIAIALFLVASVVAVKLSRGRELGSSTPAVPLATSVVGALPTASLEAIPPAPAGNPATAELVPAPTEAGATSTPAKAQVHPWKPATPTRPTPVPVKTAELVPRAAPSTTEKAKPASTLDTLLDQRK